MLVTLTNEKREKKSREFFKSFSKGDQISIRKLTSLIGTLRSTFSRNKFGPLHYRELDKRKTLGLKKEKRQYGSV